MFGVLLIPLGFTLAWLSIFGNSALDQVLHHGQQQLAQLAVDDPPTVLYALLDGYPWSRTVIAVTVLVSFIFFVTSADSGAVVLSTLSSHGGAPEDDVPRWLRVFWGTVIAVLTAGLLLAGCGSSDVVIGSGGPAGGSSGSSGPSGGSGSSASVGSGSAPAWRSATSST